MGSSATDGAAPNAAGQARPQRLGPRLQRAPGAVALALVALAATACAPSPIAGWRAGWHAELAVPNRTAVANTCQFATRLAASGTRLRLELADPASATGGGFHVQSARVALALDSSRPLTSTLTSRTVTFAGLPDTTVAPRSSRLSDSVPQSIRAGQVIVVTLTVDAGDVPSTVRVGEQGTCGAVGAKQTASAQLHWLAGVQVEGGPARSVAAFGDSITEGVALTPGRYQRWTDRVANGGTAIVNGGVSGGRLTGAGAPYSTSGLSRLPALLAQPGLTDVVLEMGINDLGGGVSSTQLLTGYQTALAQARARTVTLWVTTLLPRYGSPWDAVRERQRLAVNAALRGSWLPARSGKLIDLDAAMRNPRDPGRLLPAYDSGDHLHPNSAGALRIATAVAASMRLPAPR